MLRLVRPHSYVLALLALSCWPAWAGAQASSAGPGSSLLSNLANPAIDPYWSFVSNIVFLPDHTIDPEEVWVRSDNIPSVQLKLGKLRGSFGKHGLLHYGQQPIMSTGSGNSVRMAEDPPTLLFMIGSEVQRPPASHGARSLRPYLDQEVRGS